MMKPNQDNTNVMKNKNFSNNTAQTPMSQINLLNSELVALINGLIESIKEYYQVSLSNNTDANNIFTFYNEEEKNIQLLLNEILNNNQYQKMNEFVEKINNINKMLFQLKDNSDSCLKNLKLFFQDAKLICQHIREERQKQLIQRKSNTINVGELNHVQLISNLKTQMTNLYNRILISMNKFSDYDYIIETTGDNSINFYKGLQQNIKIDLNSLFNLIQNLEKNNRINSLTTRDAESNIERSIRINRNLENEVEKLRKSNNTKDSRIRQLMLEMNSLSNNRMISLNTENKEDVRIKKLEQIIIDKDNKLKSLINQMKAKRVATEPNNDIENIIAEKDKEIDNLQQQLNIYKQYEQISKTKLDNLTNEFQNQKMIYEKQISILKNTLSKNINNYQTNNINYEKLNRSEYNKNMNLKNFPESAKSNFNLQMNDLAKQNYNLMTILKKQKVIINGQKKEIDNYKAKISQYEQLNKKQIEEINNNIFKNNKIIEQKDELIKQLRAKKETPNSQININMSNQSNSNELLLKIENEKLKNEIKLLKLMPSNNPKNNNKENMASAYNNNFQELQQLNIKLMEENNSLKIKIANLEESNKLLTKNNDEFQNLYEQQKTTIKNLESEIAKKKEQIEGLQDFIVKLQSKLDNSNFSLPVPKAHSSSRLQKNEAQFKTQPNEEITEKMKKVLDMYNDANKKIALLQNQNKELQNKNKELTFKLEDKEVGEELSGFKTEDVNFSNYEEEFDLRKMVNGAKDKNKSEDINIDYPGMQGVKDKNKELQQRVNMLSEQVKILISNININNKIKPQINQLCQLMKIPPKNIQLIIAGKNKKQNLGIID